MKREDIDHLATLARIKLDSEEKEELAKDITEILDYVGQVGDITATEKEKKVTGVYNVLREDEPTHEPGAYTEALLDAAPNRDGQYVAVKKILDGGE